MFEDTYKTIDSFSQGVYREKGSKFIALCYPVKTEAEVKEILITVRKQYNDARHWCYAYRLGWDKSAYRTNDDGEPSGTAGKPIYGQILSHDLTNVLIVVVRYFGGVKLGVSGLIGAYKAATIDALENAQCIEKEVKDVNEVDFGYAMMNDVMSLLKLDGVKIVKTDYFDENVKILFEVNKSLSIFVGDQLSGFDNVKLTFKETI
jgi:uncharacterized YigZ family protein